MNEVRIGLIGVGWMGRAHATAIRSVPLYFGSEPAVPVLEVVADATPELAEAGARAVGCRRWTADWREVVGDANVDVIDITSPNNTHAEIAIAAAGAGKHVYCEKPLAMDAVQARAMVEAADGAGVITLVGFNFIKNPIQGLARQLIESGDIGDLILFRAARFPVVKSLDAFDFKVIASLNKMLVLELGRGFIMPEPESDRCDCN